MRVLFLCLLTLLCYTSCVSSYRAAFSDDEQSMMIKMRELSNPESINIQFIGRRKDCLRRPGGYYICRRNDSDTSWVVFVKSAIWHRDSCFSIDSVCVWTSGETMLQARRHWFHESLDYYEHVMPFSESIKIMEAFGLCSIASEGGKIIIRKLYNSGEYRDIIIERDSSFSLVIKNTEDVP